MLPFGAKVCKSAILRSECIARCGIVPFLLRTACQLLESYCAFFSLRSCEGSGSAPPSRQLQYCGLDSAL
jgi:hypothetical protein